MRLDKSNYTFSNWTQPAFTANNTWGSISTANEGMPAWNALDQNINTQWETTKLTSVTPVDFIWSFEKPLAVSQIYLMNKKSGGVYVTKSVKIYADLEKTDLITSGTFDLSGQSTITLPVDAFADCLVLECYPNDGYSANMYVGFSEITLTAAVGEEIIVPSALDAYLNTTEGMEVIINNTKKDDDTIQLTGIDWFRFNDVIAGTIYASGNHWLGFGSSSEQLKVCRRDGAMYSLYRQEGLLYGYYKFLKIRWEGYTQYNSTDVSRRLIYELFLIDTGDMFLNVIQTPTNSSYIGTSQLVCGSNTYNLNIAINSAPMITFTHQDDTGSRWAVSYEKISILPPFDRKYLIRDKGGQYYTITEGTLAQVQIDTLNAQAFREHGVEHDAFQPGLVKTLVNPTVVYWQDSDTELPKKQLSVQATPFSQVIYSGPCDMTHESIKGITNAIANCSDDALFQISFDNRQTWLIYNADAWEAVTDNTGMTNGVIETIPKEAWAERATTGMYDWKVILPSTASYLDLVKVNYIN